jgi:hypothetical protein
MISFALGSTEAAGYCRHPLVAAEAAEQVVHDLTLGRVREYHDGAGEVLQGQYPEQITES